MDLGDTEGTIALRVPDHELAREILRRTGPMAVSSANISGLPAAITCDAGRRAAGRPRSRSTWTAALGAWHGVPSTIVDFTRTDDGEVLRHGRDRALAELATDDPLPIPSDALSRADPMSRPSRRSDPDGERAPASRRRTADRPPTPIADDPDDPDQATGPVDDLDEPAPTSDPPSRRTEPRPADESSAR